MAGTITPIYGNYHGYYTRRPFVRDARLALLPPVLFSKARVLDIGCNEGWVTCEIAQSWGAHKVVGVDIDDTLIQGAWRRRRTIWSLQAPSDQGSSEDFDKMDNQIQTKKRKRNASPTPTSGPKHSQVQPDYFPLSCEHEFGPLPIPPSNIRGKHSFPHNILFRTADWVECEIPEDDEGYDVVIAFSLSKWIHLNGGDEGLRKFFRRVYSVLKPGGSFVLEPQSWDSYNKAKRMSDKLKETAKCLKIHPDDFESILCQIGFAPAQHFGYTGEGGFHRPVDVYTKNS